MSPKEVKGCVKVTHLVDGGAQAQSRPPDPRTLGFFLTVLHCCLSRHMPKVSHHCYQNQFCSLSLGRRSVRPQTTGGTFPDLSPSWCFQGSVLCPATAHQLPLCPGQAGALQGGAAEVMLSTCRQPGWGNISRKLPDLLPTGFFHPLTAAGSSLKLKGVPGNLLQIISLSWEQAPCLHSRHICTCLPEVK